MSISKEQKERILNMPDYQILRQPFNVEVHKLKFISYLEVIILEDGTIEYAAPSHQEKMLQIIQEKKRITREELWNSVSPIEFGMEWMNKESGAVPVWEDYFGGIPNEKQVESLKFLKEEGLYKGSLIAKNRW